MKPSLEIKLFIPFTILLIVIALLSWEAKINSKKNENMVYWVENAQEVLSRSQKISSFIKDIQNGMRGYAITGDSSFLSTYQTSSKNIYSNLLQLQSLTKENPVQLKRIDSLKTFTRNKIDFSDQVIALRTTNGYATARNLIDSRKGEYMNEIENIIDRLESEENRLLTVRKTANEKSINDFNKSYNVQLIAVAIVLIAFFIALYNLVKNKKTEKKVEESERRLKTFIKSGPDAVIVINEEQQILEWNPKAEKIFGFTVEDVINKSLSETIIPLHYREAHNKGMAHFLKTGEGPVLGKTIEITALHKKGHEFYIDLSISSVKLEGEWIFIAFLSDITERKKLEENVSLINKELESFTYSVSHDLRAPLRIITGYAQMIKEKNKTLAEEPKGMLENIIRNAERMGTLIDDLLNFSRLGRRELVTHETDMNAIVQPILEQHLNAIVSPDVRVHNLPGCFCDSSLIKQVWENLISNAIKYSGRKSNLFIEIGAVLENNNTVYYIKDKGAGFDMAYYDKLFGVFQRLHTASEFEGTGVGLALAQRIILKHGGKIWAESKVNEGSTFYFTVCKS